VTQATAAKALQAPAASTSNGGARP
jgi:hypothetical protein